MDRESLTPREQDVLNLIAIGKTNKDIAAHLCITQRTVEQHLTHIYRKIGVNNRTEALIWKYTKNSGDPQ